VLLLFEASKLYKQLPISVVACGNILACVFLSCSVMFTAVDIIRYMTTVYLCYFDRCNVVVRCEALWDLARCCAADDVLFSRLPPSSRRQLCRCLTLPVIAKFDDGRKDVYIQLVILACRGNSVTDVC